MENQIDHTYDDILNEVLSTHKPEYGRGKGTIYYTWLKRRLLQLAKENNLLNKELYSLIEDIPDIIGYSSGNYRSQQYTWIQIQALGNILNYLLEKSRRALPDKHQKSMFTYWGEIYISGYDLRGSILFKSKFNPIPNINTSKKDCLLPLNMVSEFQSPTHTKSIVLDICPITNKETLIRELTDRALNEVVQHFNFNKDLSEEAKKRFIICKCLPGFKQLFLSIDKEGITKRIKPEIIADSLYNLCIKYNSRLTISSEHLEEEPWDTTPEETEDFIVEDYQDYIEKYPQNVERIFGRITKATFDFKVNKLTD